VVGASIYTNRPILNNQAAFSSAKHKDCKLV
jgi:hypothetical protein